jgi:hypothetical protein
METKKMSETTEDKTTTEVADRLDGIVMRWTPIEESLPADGSHMVLVTRYGETDVAFWRKGKFLEEPMGFEATGVTAWMYKPAPFGA